MTLSKRCEACEGTGQAEPNCRACGGWGFVTCGIGEVICEECHNEDCPDCGGTGEANG